MFVGPVQTIISKCYSLYFQSQFLFKIISNIFARTKIQINEKLELCLSVI